MNPTRRIRERSPQTAILIITGVPGSLDRCPEYHAHAYEILLKPSSLTKLCQRVDLALSAQPALITSWRTIRSQREALRERKLDGREVAALEGLSRHEAYKEIAAEQNWFIVLTAKLLRRALAKLGVRRREEAVEIWKQQTQ